MNICAFLVYVIFCLVINSCATEPAVSYQREIKPILVENCFQCHTLPNGAGYTKTGLSVESYETLMQGTVYGVVIIPGDSRRSILNKLVEGRAGNLMRMPHGSLDPLAEKEIQLFRLWVNQGALNN